MKASVVADLIKANAVLQKIKDSPLVIALPNLGKFYNIIIKYYTRTSLANLPYTWRTCNFPFWKK